MKSPQFIRAKLVNRTNADCSSVEAKNNRWHYRLRFEQSIGWDWLEAQILKAQRETETALELWELHPSGVSDFEVEVREVERREGIDDNQNSLDDFS
jgi:hypothetical protein